MPLQSARAQDSQEALIRNQNCLLEEFPMTKINLAGAALLVLSGTALAQQAPQDTTKPGADKQETSKQETVKIRRDGDTSRPPMDTAEQTREEYQKHLDNVNQAYRNLPEEEDRPADQPDRTKDGRTRQN